MMKETGEHRRCIDVKALWLMTKGNFALEHLEIGAFFEIL